MKGETSKAFEEVYVILQLLDEELISKVPDNVIKFIESERDTQYNIKISPDIAIEEQNLLTDTYNILAILKIKYWCKNNEEKQKMMYIINKNERRYQELLHEKYNPDNLFKNNKVDENIKEKCSLLEIKNEKWYEKIRSFFIKIFKKY